MAAVFNRPMVTSSSLASSLGQSGPDALDSLSSAHRQVLGLNAEGLTQSQIAARLGLPLGTVKTRAFHAMRALRAALARRDFDLTS